MTESFLRRCFLKPFLRFPDLNVFVSTCLSFPLPCCLSQLSSALCQGSGIATGSWIKPRAVKEPSQHLNTEALPSRSMVLSKGRREFEGYCLCFQCVLFTWNPRELTAPHVSHSRVCLGNEGLGCCSHHRDKNANTACFIASEIKSSQSNGQKI